MNYVVSMSATETMMLNEVLEKIYLKWTRMFYIYTFCLLNDMASNHSRYKHIFNKESSYRRYMK